MKYLAFLLCLIVCTSCSHDPKKIDPISKEIESQLKKSDWESVDLSKVVNTSFERVCILGPYTDNNRTEQVLGFKWDSKEKTSIYGNDGVNVLVFIQDDKVVNYVEHPRNLGDFAELSGECFEREKAIFTRKVRGDNWVSLISKAENIPNKIVEPIKNPLEAF